MIKHIAHQYVSSKSRYLDAHMMFVQDVYD